MIYCSEIGKYNVTVLEGQLNHRNNKWYYVLQIDTFNSSGEWTSSKYYYIEGHKDGDFIARGTYHRWVREFMAELDEDKIEEILKYKEHYHFNIIPPTKVALR